MSSSSSRALSSIVTDGFLQFYDAAFNVHDLKKTKRHFLEVPAPTPPGPDGKKVYQLRCLDYDERDQVYADRRAAVAPGARPARNANLFPSYSLGADKALEPFVEEWLPIPVFRRIGERADGSPRFGAGPSNWARLYVHALPEPDADGNTHRVVLAFDPTVEPQGPDDVTAALSPRDMAEGGEYQLVVDERECDWFLASGWVVEWVEELFVRARRRQKGRPLREDDFEFHLEHVARYITLLQALEDSGAVPRFRLINPTQYHPVDVDLVVDIGNSRTCGILIETHVDQATDLNDSLVLELRDLSQPFLRYDEPFSSRIEFSLGRFGNEALSRESGRSTQAFSWPSVVRVGPEALRLGASAKRGEGMTGMSSPKRYLWDEHPRSQEWRFNAGSAEDGNSEPPVVRGAFVQFVNDQGTPLEGLNDPRIQGRSSPYAGQTDDPVTSSRFSRSSLMMFMLSEILAQALLALNSPAVRAKRRNADIPRRLRSLILTMPTAMPLAERNIFRRMAEWAVDTTWRALGWEQHIDGQRSAGRSREFRLSPRVRCDWDEASATQLVLLYNEVAARFQGDIGFAFQLLGRKRPGYGERESLRLASLDLGGGTTDLIITTYEAVGDRAAAVIRPTQEFREGFNIAGDDILRRVVEGHVLPALKQALTDSGVTGARDLLTELFGGDFGNQAEGRKILRAQFTHQVLARVALRMLGQYERHDLRQGARTDTLSFADCFPPGTQPPEAILDFFDEPVRRAGSGLSIRDVSFPVNLAEVDRTVASVIEEALTDLSEIIHLYDCDLLVLSGRTSCLPAILSVLRSRLSLEPHRIVPTHLYRVGRWYPFRTAQGRIADPKTTAAVGAMLCALAEGKLEGFAFQGDRLTTRSTARYFGDLEASGRIAARHVLFGPLDLEATGEIELESTFDFFTKTFIGFRQLDADRWPATPLYALDFADNIAVANARGRTPYKVTLAFKRKDAEQERHQERAEGAFVIAAIESADGSPVRRTDLTLRLQTMRESQGYWLDTGTFTVV